MKKPAGYNFPEVKRDAYSIDVFNVLDQISNIYMNNLKLVPELFNTQNYFQEKENNFMNRAKKEGVDLSENQKYRNFIIPSSFDTYPDFLAFTLLVIDPIKIGLLLTYQSKMFLGNHYAEKNNFIGLVEHQIYNQVKNYDIFNQNIRLEKIVEWVKENKVFLKKKVSKYDDVNFKIVEIENEFAKVLYEKLNFYFPKKHHSNLENLLVNGVSTNICFNGNRNQLAELFKRLLYNKKIAVNTLDGLAHWLITNFYVLNKFGKQEVFKKDTILQVLHRIEDEPPKSKKILLDIAPFLSENNRKDQ